MSIESLADSPIEDALHTLAQPLMALSFQLEIARRQADPLVWKSTLDSALVECQRAFTALEQLRAAAAAQKENKA